MDHDPAAARAQFRARRETAPDDLLHLLPIYDEYLIAYRDRVAVPHGPPAIGSASRNSVTFQHALVIGGQVAGTWRLSRRREAVDIEIVPLRPLTALERRALGRAVERYERFLESPVQWAVRQAS